jgi:hypothetical protein
MFKPILALILLFIALEVNAEQCIKLDNNYNCGGKIYRRTGNRVLGPNGQQYYIQNNRITKIGTNIFYTKQGSKVVRNDGVSFSRQGSFVISSDGKQYTRTGNFINNPTDDTIAIELLLE